MNTQRGYKKFYRGFVADCAAVLCSFYV